MNSEQIARIENDSKLKKKIFGKNIWKNYAFVPPTLILFTGLTGVVYLFKADLYKSWYIAPFVFLLVLGAIWFKAVKRYLINNKYETGEAILVCLSIVLTEIGGKTIMMFSTGNNRNNKYYLEKEKSDILKNLKDNDLTAIVKSGKTICGTDIHLTYLPKKVSMFKSTYFINNYYWVIYNRFDNNILFLKKNDMFQNQK